MSHAASAQVKSVAMPAATAASPQKGACTWTWLRPVDVVALPICCDAARALCDVQGGRLMRHWVAHPLSHAPSILARLDAVQELHAAGSAGRALTAGAPPPTSSTSRQHLAARQWEWGSPALSTACPAAACTPCWLST